MLTGAALTDAVRGEQQEMVAATTTLTMV